MIQSFLIGRERNFNFILESRHLLFFTQHFYNLSTTQYFGQVFPVGIGNTIQRGRLERKGALADPMVPATVGRYNLQFNSFKRFAVLISLLK